MDKEYHKAYIRRHYAQNKQYYKTKAKEAKARAQRWFNSLKLELSCVECDESHPACLDFHHREGETKLFNLAGAWKRHSRQKILDEIQKCDVLCANCHRKHTAVQQDWYPTKESNPD